MRDEEIRQTLEKCSQLSQTAAQNGAFFCVMPDQSEGFVGNMEREVSFMDEIVD
jgi:hypothetical protein